MNNLINNIDPGDIILFDWQSINIFKFFELYLKPSHFSHISIYYGNNLLNGLNRLKYNIINDTDESKLMKMFYEKKSILEKINKYIKIINNDENYFLDFYINGFKITPFNKYIKKKKINNMAVIKCFNCESLRYLYLYHLGTKFGIFNGTYCFKSIADILVKIFNYNDNFIYYNKHYNSYFFTNNKNIKLKLYYRKGILLKCIP